MKKTLLHLVVLILIFGTLNAFSQNGSVKNPYVVGEELVYQGKYKKFGLSFSIADLGFTVSKEPDGKTIRIKSLATSRGTLSKLFGFTFLQDFKSTVDAEKLRILKTEKRDKQRKRIRESVADFDYNDMQVTYVETDPVDPSRPPKRVASTITTDTQDVVSAFYMLRQMPLEVGAKFYFKISDSGLVYDLPVNITARERKKSILGTLWCWRIEPEIFGEGKFIEQKGGLTIWITDDARRVPVRAKLDTKFGGVDIKLKKIDLNGKTDEMTDESSEDDDEN